MLIEQYPNLNATLIEKYEQKIAYHFFNRRMAPGRYRRQDEDQADMRFV